MADGSYHASSDGDCIGLAVLCFPLLRLTQGGAGSTQVGKHSKQVE